MYLVWYMSNDIYLQVHCSLRLFSFPLFILLTLLPEESPEAPGADEGGETENSWEILVTFMKWPIRHWNEDKVKFHLTIVYGCYPMLSLHGPLLYSLPITSLISLTRQGSNGQPFINYSQRARMHTQLGCILQMFTATSHRWSHNIGINVSKGN